MYAMVERLALQRFYYRVSV